MGREGAEELVYVFFCPRTLIQALTPELLPVLRQLI